MTDDDDVSQRLGDTGQVYVTGSAALAYERYSGLQAEEARRELTRVLLGARPYPPDPGAGAERWRWRGRPEEGADKTDIEVTVIREDGLAVVTRAHCRWQGRRGDRAAYGRRRRQRQRQIQPDPDPEPT